jgi:hypothetical protein
MGRLKHWLHRPLRGRLDAAPRSRLDLTVASSTGRTAALGLGLTAAIGLGLTVALGLGLALAIVTPSLASAEPDVRFDAPSASGEFGETITFATTFRSASPPLRVELLSQLPGGSAQQVSRADVEQVGADTWRAVVYQAGHVVPNTTYEYRFRVVTDTGAALGPSATHRVDDLRLDWQELAGEHVTVWWHEGDAAFAERALDIAERGLSSAAELLGVSAVDDVDFFIYSDSREFRQALGPATRENVGGEAHPYIDTLFGLIEPNQVGSGWVEELVLHELAHIVFDEAVANPYGYPPRWLNEGLAVYLAKGYSDGDRAQVESAAGAGSIIPLEALGGQFPTRPGRFGLAYAESVSAVAYLVERYGEDGLVELITSFADGTTLDEAFVAATGASFADFEDAWLAALGTERPEPYGPQPAEPGPLPGAWASPAAALLP